MKPAARGSLKTQNAKKSPKIAIWHHRTTLLRYVFATKARIDNRKLDGCIVWNAHNTVLGEEALLVYVVSVCYVKQISMERPSNIIISLHRKKFQLLRIFY